MLKSFTKIAEHDLLKLIREMPTKTCESDIIPTILLKEVLPTIIPSLTKIANLSTSKGVFSETWKSATVKPLIKSQSKGTDHQNYRPVSNLTFLSKVVEKITLNQFTQHCEVHHLLPDYKSAYRKHHSCETSLIKLVNNILWAMEKQEVTAVRVLDLSVAFDTVDHDLLLTVLDRRFGVKGTALKWYEQYLKPRKFKVSINNTYSSEQTINYSVPQGSIQGAFLFNAYASTITEVIPPTLELMGYADDHSIRKPFRPGNTIGITESDTITIMEDSMLGISKWMNEVRLKLNESKTDFIYFGSKNQLKKCTFDKIKINNETIQRSDLGGHLDQNLNLRKHVVTKCKTAMMNIWKIRLIRKFLTRDICHQLTLSLAISHLDYSNAILIGCLDTTLSLMQRVQNTAARMILNKHRSYSATECLKPLHWLPIKSRIIYKVLVTVFKCRHGMAPKYLQDLLKAKENQRQGLKSNNKQLLKVPATTRKTFADRSFSVKGPKLWNDLPDNIQTILSYAEFKKQLKTHLFKSCYN